MNDELTLTAEQEAEFLDGKGSDTPADAKEGEMK